MGMSLDSPTNHNVRNCSPISDYEKLYASSMNYFNKNRVENLVSILSSNIPMVNVNVTNAILDRH